VPEEGEVAEHFGERLALVGWAANGVEALRPGSTLDLVLDWRCLAPVGQRYTVFAQIIGPDGQVHSQHDGEPVFGTHPTDLWREGEIVVDRRTLALGGTAVRGEYRLIVGFYNPETGERLPVGSSDHLEIGGFRLEP
jgi:mannosyltransferase